DRQLDPTRQHSDASHLLPGSAMIDAKRIPAKSRLKFCKLSQIALEKIDILSAHLIYSFTDYYGGAEGEHEAGFPPGWAAVLYLLRRSPVIQPDQFQGMLFNAFVCPTSGTRGHGDYHLEPSGTFELLHTRAPG